MARVNRVRKAKQRYEMVPVIDPATGQQREVPVMGRDGQQKTTKHGRPVTMRLTQPDLTRPLPPEECDRDGTKILPGMPYKWIEPRSGPYGGRRMVRCADCPDWQPWEYSGALWAQLALVSHNFQTAVDSAESAEDVEAALEEAAGEIEQLADEREESAQNMQDGFGGNETEPVMNLKDQAEQLRSWADEIRNSTVPELPEPEEDDCGTCNATGRVVQLYHDSPIVPWRPGSYADGVVRDCGPCEGTGRLTPEEPTDEQMDDWRDEVRADLSIVDENPL